MEYIKILRNKQIIDKKLDEYYNSLATNIKFLGKDIKKIVLTSVFENEGKSTISINLAKSLAEIGCKVIFIDADTRKSVMYSRFKYRGEVLGLTSYLSGDTELQNTLYRTDVENLTILPSGLIPPNPVSLLQNKNLDIMLDVFEKYYDYIIIDTPPIGSVIDPAIIAKKSDGSILVVEEGRVKKKFIKKAKTQLEQSGSNFLGVILNKADFERNEYGNYGKE